MSSRDIAIINLPSSLDISEAVEVAYQRDLDKILSKLTQNISVLIECDKQLSMHLYVALRNRLRRHERSKSFTLVSGHIQNTEGPTRNLLSRILAQLTQAVFSGTENQIIVIPHLDILSTTTRSGLNIESREAAALLYENPYAVFLAFKDPSFELPKVIENIFAAKCSFCVIFRALQDSRIFHSLQLKMGKKKRRTFADLTIFFRETCKIDEIL